VATRTKASRRAVAKTAAAADAGGAKTLAFETLSIREVGQRHLEIQSMLERGDTEIDVGALASVDTAGLQLLLAAAHAAQRRGLRLRLRGAQRLLSDAARLLGMEAQLGALAEIVP
jgi:anti-anti-sigma regulatory factor